MTWIVVTKTETERDIALGGPDGVSQGPPTTVAYRVDVCCDNCQSVFSARVRSTVTCQQCGQKIELPVDEIPGMKGAKLVLDPESGEWEWGSLEETP